MPFFSIEDRKLNLHKSKNFQTEKELQKLIEENLETVFNCRFIATEFSTGNEHAGRIDSLGLSEDNNPVILEYKKVESSELVNQSLYYLSWIKDHKGDFQIAVNKALNENVEVDWSDIRVICIAPGYKKFDLHAVQMMGANIELWQYRLYENGSLYLEEIFKRATAISGSNLIDQGKNPVMVEAGKKAAFSRQNNSYTIEQHLENTDPNIARLFSDIRDSIMTIDESVEEAPKKFYIAYKVSQNFACVELKKNKIVVTLKIDPKVEKLPHNARDVSAIGHYGTGDFELTVSNDKEVEEARSYILKSFGNIGG